MEPLADAALKLLIAVLLGGAIGLERELVGKPAGLRTNILIAVGSTLITLVSVDLAGQRGDPARLAAQIVTGVGFIGAGTILQARGAVVGLTTAATIWTVAGVGIAVGAGATPLAVGTTVLIVACLTLLRWIERWNIGRRSLVTLEIVCRSEAATQALFDLICSKPFRIEESTVRKTEGGVALAIAGTTTPAVTNQLLGEIAASEDVVSVDARH